MFRTMTIIAGVLALGLSVGGCSKCGFWWDDAPRSCREPAKPGV
jgi:hypothetical protein